MCVQVEDTATPAVSEAVHLPSSLTPAIHNATPARGVGSSKPFHCLLSALSAVVIHHDSQQRGRHDVAIMGRVKQLVLSSPSTLRPRGRLQVKGAGRVIRLYEGMHIDVRIVPEFRPCAQVKYSRSWHCCKLPPQFKQKNFSFSSTRGGVQAIAQVTIPRAFPVVDEVAEVSVSTQQDQSNVKTSKACHHKRKSSGTLLCWSVKVDWIIFRRRVQISIFLSYRHCADML